MKFFILFIVCFGSISTTPLKAFEDQTALPSENSDLLTQFRNALETGNIAADFIQKCTDYRKVSIDIQANGWEYFTGSKIEHENNIIFECMQEYVRLYNKGKEIYTQMNLNLEQIRDILDKKGWNGAKERYLGGFNMLTDSIFTLTNHELCSLTQGYSPSVSFPTAKNENFVINSRNSRENSTSVSLKSITYIVNVKVNSTKLIVNKQFVEALIWAVDSTEDSINNYRGLVQVLNEYGWFVPIKYTVGDVIYYKKFEKGVRSEPIIGAQNNWHIIRYDNYLPSLLLLHNHNNSLLTICLRLLRDHFYVEEVRNLQPKINIEFYQNEIERIVNL